MGFTTVITTLIGTVIGALKEIWVMNQQAKNRMQEALMAKAGIQINDTQDARKHTYQFARRLIVICFCLVILTPVFISVYSIIVYNTDATFYVPIEVTKGGFSFLFGLISGQPVTFTQYVPLKGFVYVLSILDMIGFMVGFYFGSSGTQARR